MSAIFIQPPELTRCSWQMAARVVAAAFGFSFTQARKERTFWAERYTVKINVKYAPRWIYVAIYPRYTTDGKATNSYVSFSFDGGKWAHVTYHSCPVSCLLASEFRWALYFALHRIEGEESAARILKWCDLGGEPTAHQKMESGLEYKELIAKGLGL